VNRIILSGRPAFHCAGLILTAHQHHLTEKGRTVFKVIRPDREVAVITNMYFHTPQVVFLRVASPCISPGGTVA
jgi:hypothetical protein